MRMMLRAVLLMGALVGTGAVSMEAAQAAEKAKSKTQATSKEKASSTARTSSAKGAAQTSKARPKSSASGSTRVAKASKTASPAKARRETADSRKSASRVLPSDVDLWQESGHLAVRSGSALVISQDGGETLYEKNARVVVPIASITKVMTAMVVLDSMPNLQESITITDDDVDYLKGSRSRLRVGAVLTREMALLLALMSSENRAANALARHYPGGLPAFVAAMNRKATSLGMARTHFEDPTGLTSHNVSTAHDLARMVAAAYHYPLIREFSTTSGVTAEVKGRELEYRNTNQLVKSPTWEIGLSKTGYIQEAGKCLVMQARVADRPVVIVLLDSDGKQTRIGDANRIRRWMESVASSGKQPTPA
ncbi:MAG: D-alanyl-D-alanine endopeptidase [Candidatus Accumulibacter sp.]|uniref:D-alanyl-D-alanine endopeptidase n=1 Tax=Accumulibacter sp. TaxID=2053492 RepID=UPI0019E71101|nr:D-alanyl-D-alanine endopeptidase [Accumulibacter sp.]MBE2260214.1 D-alanyl-D-alanine endopeptidase [Paracoccaceae bacterium]MCP5247470.1 D-alanyl-D-alanine endopeptidase [Accumulibacter sp.]